VDGDVSAEVILTTHDKIMDEAHNLGASNRHPMHVMEAARLGADVVTMP